MTHDCTGNFARVWRLVLAAIEHDDDAKQRIYHEMGDCRACWQRATGYLAEHAATDYVFSSEGIEAGIRHVEGMIQGHLDAAELDRRREERTMTDNKPDSHCTDAEFAMMSGRNTNPYYDLHRRTGISVRHIVELARTDKLSELFDSRGRLVGEIPQSAGELRRAVEALRTPQTQLGHRPLIPGRLASQLVEVVRLRQPAAYAFASPVRQRNSRKPKRIVSVVRDPRTGRLVPLKVE
jgi:hypothetical protein